MLVFASNGNGAVRGEGLGFLGGLIQDLISSGPLGFNALIRTLIGFLYGKLKGILYLDSILLPALFIIIATFMKELLSFVFVSILMPDTIINFFDRSFLIELGLNAFFSPFIFALVKGLKIYRPNEKDDF